MAIADLKATLSLEYGDYKANLKSAQSAMDDAAKTTKQTMETVSSESKKTQGVFNNFSGTTKTVFDGIGSGATKAKELFGVAFNKMADDGDRFKQQQGSLVGTLAKTATAFVGIKSAADLFNSAIARVDKIQSAEKAIASLTGSQKDAKTVMEGLQKVVDGTPLSLDSFTASAKGMIAAGMDADKVEPIMRAVGDAAYGVGEGAPSIDIMAGAFKSLQASGTASLGDLNRLMDQNIPVYKILGNQLEMSTQDMKDYISDGMLPAGKAMDLLAKGIEEGTDGINGSTASMAGQMQTAGTTIAGAAGNIKTALVKSLAVPITESYEKIVSGMIAVKDGIKSLQPQLEAVFSSMAAIIEGIILGLVDTFKMLIPVVNSVITVLKGVAKSFGISEVSGKELTEMARQLTPVILALFAGFKAYKIIATTASTLRTMSAAIKGVEGAMAALGPVTKALSMSIKGVSAAMSFLAANPIVLVIATLVAVAAAIVYFWKTNEDFRNAVKAIWDKIVKVFNECGKSIKQFIDDVVKFFTEMWQSIKEIWDKVTSYISNVVEKIGQIVTVGFMLVAEVVKGVMLIIKTAIELYWNAIVAFWTTIFEVIKALFTFAFEVIERIVTSVMTAIKEFIVSVWTGIVEFFTPIFEAIAEIFTTAWNTIKDIVMAVLTPLTEAVKVGWEFIKEITLTIWTAITETLQTIWNGLVSIVTAIWETMKMIISTAWNVIKEVTIAIWTPIKEWLVNTWNSIVAIAKAVWTALANFFTAVWNGIKTVTITIWTGIKDFLTGVWDSIKSISSAVWNAIKDLISSIWNSIKSTISSIANGIRNTISSVWNSIKSTTSSVWEGIKEAMIRPVERAKEIISNVIDSIKGFFSGISLRLPEIEMPALPHFSLSGDFSLNPPSVPSLSVDWYATGGIATAPSVVGIGEAGDEAIVPLSNKGRMKPFAQAVSSMIDRDSSKKNLSSDTIIIKENTFVVREEADIDKIAEALHRKAKREKV